MRPHLYLDAFNLLFISDIYTYVFNGSFKYFFFKIYEHFSPSQTQCVPNAFLINEVLL